MSNLSMWHPTALAFAATVEDPNNRCSALSLQAYHENIPTMRITAACVAVVALAGVASAYANFSQYEYNAVDCRGKPSNGAEPVAFETCIGNLDFTSVKFIRAAPQTSAWFAKLATFATENCTDTPDSGAFWNTFACDAPLAATKSKGYSVVRGCNTSSASVHSGCDIAGNKCATVSPLLLNKCTKRVPFIGETTAMALQFFTAEFVVLRSYPDDPICLGAHTDSPQACNICSASWNLPSPYSTKYVL
jgi:hypothetical protein